MTVTVIFESLNSRSHPESGPAVWSVGARLAVGKHESGTVTLYAVSESNDYNTEMRRIRKMVTGIQLPDDPKAAMQQFRQMAESSRTNPL